MLIAGLTASPYRDTVTIADDTALIAPLTVAPYRDTATIADDTVSPYGRTATNLGNALVPDHSHTVEAGTTTKVPIKRTMPVRFVSKTRFL